MALACMGDFMMLVIGTISALVVFIYRLVCSHDVDKKLYLLLIILTISASALGLLSDKLFFIIGGANKNSFVENRSFSDLNLIPKRFEIYIHAILGLLDADFSGKALIRIDTLWYILRICVLIYAIFIIIRHVISLIFNKNVDIVGSILSIGFLLISFVFILTDISVDINSARYIAYSPVLFAVLIIRYYKANNILERTVCYSKILLKYKFGLLATILIISAFVPSSFSIQENTSQYRLGEFLNKQGLVRGYSHFWNASHVTVSTKNKIQIRAINSDGASVSKFGWFCKEDWYQEYANFVVMNNEQHPHYNFHGISEEIIRKVIGEPTNKLIYEDFIIYVYDWNISDALLISQS